MSRATTEELLRALAYPTFALDEEEMQGVLAAYVPWAVTVEVESAPVEGLPTCRDPGDQMFLTLTAAAGAEALVSGDSDLLSLASDAPFHVWKPSQLRRRLGL